MNWILSIKHSFKKKVIFLLLSVSLLVCIPLLFKYYSDEQKQLNNILDIQIKQLVRSFALNINDDVRYNNYINLSDDIMSIYNFSNQMKFEDGNLFYIVAIAITDMKGNILAHSEPDKYPLLTPYSNITEENQKLFLSHVRKTVMTHNIKTDIIKVKSPIEFESEVVGFVIMDIDAFILSKKQKTLVKNLFFISLFLIFLLTIIIFVLGGWIEKPLAEIMNGVQNLGSGEVDFQELNNRKDEFNILAVSLEKVDRRIHAQTMLLIKDQQELEDKVKERTFELEKSTNELKETLEILTLSQKQLIESEKMSALGSLVAGVAHEINTPVGVSLTGITHIQAETKEIISAMNDESLGKNALFEYLEMVDKMAGSMHLSLLNAANLIRSFKQVAVDQHIEDKRTFDLREYCDEILLSLHNRLKQTRIRVSNNIEADILITSYAGIFSQIITNFIMNSLAHAFEKQQQGEIIISGNIQANNLIMTYRDNGKGIDESIIEKIFDPFFTTKLGQGGSGLGLNIIYNLITHKLNGDIKCENVSSSGILMTIQIPMAELKNSNL